MPKLDPMKHKFEIHRIDSGYVLVAGGVRDIPDHIRVFKTRRGCVMHHAASGTADIDPATICHGETNWLEELAIFDQAATRYTQALSEAEKIQRLPKDRQAAAVNALLGRISRTPPLIARGLYTKKLTELAGNALTNIKGGCGLKGWRQTNESVILEILAGATAPARPRLLDN